ncbi:glycosyltransferase family 4 protein [Thermococcus sp. 21S7]|uniref:glycosyltransferase family 4 protein n=1 Tax=Thermococcus sp. 21S7 TaxID=1638221 RepID=UPI0014391504|nr:glycosyltransferase family 4 protein [Thermococcus sp. 21S7]NJE61792.1 glycosyltransferase [Thermococcus sp. 21S7]
MKRPRVVMTLSNPFKVDPRVYKEALTLVNGGYDVTILAWDREGVHPLRETVDGINVERIRVRAKYGSIIGFVVALPLFYLAALIRLLKMDFDVIHTHDFDTAPLGALIKLLRGKPWIFDIHDIYFTRISLLKERPSLGIFQRILMKLEILHAKFADVVVVVTRSLGGEYEGFKEFYVERGVPPDRIKIVWNTPRASMFLDYPRLGLKKSSKFTIGYIGSIRTVSNFVPLFELAKKRGYKLLFVGSGKSKEAVERIAREEFPEVDVEFTGGVPYELIPNYYRLCDVLYSYFPPTENVKRTITVKVFESAFLGVPVIVNAESLMEDFVRLNNCGVAIKEPSKGELERAIDIVREFKFSPKKIRQKWVWEAQEGLILSIYGRLIKRATG